MQLTLNILEHLGSLTPTPLTINSGGIEIGGGSNSGSATSLVVTVADNTSVTITVTQPGYHTYNMTIDDVFTSDNEIDVVLVPVVTDISDPNYNRPAARFFTFKGMCGFDVAFYSATSYSLSPLWYVNNELYQEGGEKGVIKFYKPGSYQLKHRVRSYSPDGSLMWDRVWADNSTDTEVGNSTAGIIPTWADILDFDLDTNLTIVEYRPVISLAASTPVNQLENSCCYTKGEGVTITPTVTLVRDGAIASDHTITYQVIDPEGNEVSLGSATFSLDALNMDLVFTPEALGTYAISATVNDVTCDESFLKTMSVETCDFVVLDYVDCNTYTINNKSSATDMTYTITSIDGVVIEDAGSLIAGDTATVTFSDISLYLVAATFTPRGGVETTLTYVLNNYCGLDDCIATYILDILCGEERRCVPCPDDVELNQMLLLSYTYFMKLNKEYGWNNFYSTLEDSKLAELTNIKQTMDKLNAFCSRRSCNTASFNTAAATGSYTWPTSAGCSTCN